MRDLYNDEFEFSDTDFAELLDAITNDIKEYDNGTHVINPERYAEFLDAYKLIIAVTKKIKAKVSYKFNEPFMSMGSIHIVGKVVDVLSVGKFADAVLLADNIEIYPQTDGVVHCTLTFHGLTDKIKD